VLMKGLFLNLATHKSVVVVRFSLVVCVVCTFELCFEHPVGSVAGDWPNQLRALICCSVP
jgi:hypothetical protein